MSRGDSWEKQRAASLTIPIDIVGTIPRCPQLLCWDLNMLEDKSASLSTMSGVGRYLTRTGYVAMQQVPAIGEFRAIRKRVYAARRESVMDMMVGPEFLLPEGGRPLDKPVYTRVFWWVRGGLADIALELRMDLHNITLLAFCMALMQSAVWVPSRAVGMCLDGVRRWVLDLEDRVNVLRGLAP